MEGGQTFSSSQVSIRVADDSRGLSSESDMSPVAETRRLHSICRTHDCPNPNGELPQPFFKGVSLSRSNN